MTVVIYKNCRIEIEYDGAKAYFEILSPNGIILEDGYSEAKKKDLIESCKAVVDQLKD
jgi:hypothetical protein